MSIPNEPRAAFASDDSGGSGPETATDLAHARAALRASEARFRSIVTGSPQGIIIQQQGRIVFANPAMARLFGYPDAEAMIGLDPFLDLIAEADLQFFRRRTEAVYGGDVVEPTPSWRARRQDGREVWISSTAHRSEWEGRPAVTSFYIDITDRKHAEIALRENEALYRSALTAGRMGAWETDLVTRTRTWTAEGLALFGLSLADGRGVVGGPDDEYVAALHPEDRHLVPDFYRQADEQDSFTAEYRVVRPDGVVLWLSGRGQVLSRQPDGRAGRIVSIMADITERKSRELQIQFLLREITHRSRNLLAVIQSLAKQTARTTDDFQQFHEGLARRLQGLAASHDVLIRGTWEGANMRELVDEHLAAFVDRQSSRITISGPDVVLLPDAAQAVGLAIHELATNALKYGALSVPTGHVDLSWSRIVRDGDSQILLSWAEQGGPAVSPPVRRGFGHVVLQDVVASALQAEITFDYCPSGLQWHARFSARHVTLPRPAAG